MKTQIHAKNKKKIIIFLFLIILLGSGGILFYFFYSNKEIETTVSFLNIDDTEVDSLLQTMSLEQKVTQLLIISSADTISLAEDISLGGIFIETNNFNHYKKYFNSAHKENVQSPLICSKSDILLPNFLNKYYNLPDFNSLISLSDSLLLEKYINFANSQDSVLGINFRYLSFINDISDTLNSDTNLINLYDKFASKLVQIAINHNQLICLPYLYTPSGDTILHQIQNRFYSSLLSNGLPAIYLQEEKAIEQFMLNYKFNGLLIRNADISNYEDFLKSDFDVIIVDSSYEKVYANILKTAKSKRKFKKLLDKKVKKILLAKTWLSQNHSITNKIETKASELYDINTDLLFHKIKKKSLIVFNNTDYFIPIKNINKKTICYILGNDNCDLFIETIKKYQDIKVYNMPDTSSKLMKKIKIDDKSNIIFVINNKLISSDLAKRIAAIDSVSNLIIVNFSEMRNLELLGTSQHLLHVWQSDEISQSYAGQVIYGGIASTGIYRLPLPPKIFKNKGIKTSKTRIGYDYSEMVGISSEKLKKIDSLAEDAIRKYACPGCQVFAAKDGIVLINKSYGFHTYSKQITVKNTDLYDIASVTKIAATTLSAMKLNEQGKLPLDNEISKYFKDTRIEYARIKPDTTIKIDTLYIKEEKNWEKKIDGLDTVNIGDSIVISYDTVIYKLTPKNNIFKITPRLLLEHRSGIQPALPILKLMLLDNDYFMRIRDLYDDTLDSLAELPKFREKWDRIYVNSYIKDSAEIQVANAMYMKNAFFDTLWRDTKELAVWSKKTYVYSDVNMIILQIAIDSINGFGINKFLNKTFYKPLGLHNITFLPKKKFDKKNIVPTEKENYWRRQLIWGHVHDPSAALLGGVAGNAGLFSNAYSLGVIAQMLLNKGSYGGRQFLSEGTIDKFSATQPDTYRGLGFDKWSKRQIIAKDASPETYGHTGFTGACVWIDPESKIVFVFLSNRVHPSANNWKLNKYRVRQNIHQAIYDAEITNN